MGCTKFLFDARSLTIDSGEHTACDLRMLTGRGGRPAGRWDGRGEVGKSGSELLEQRISEVWTVHLHNQWNKRFPIGGWMDSLFERYAVKLDEISRARGSNQVTA